MFEKICPICGEKFWCDDETHGVVCCECIFAECDYDSSELCPCYELDIKPCHKCEKYHKALDKLTKV